MNDKIIKEANTYLNNDKSMKDTAKELGVSIKTLQIHFKKLEEIDEDIYKLVLNKKKSNIKIGNIMGGQTSKALKTYTKDEANTIALQIISRELTYEEAAEIFDIPKSTIYDMVHSEYIDNEIKTKLELVARSNHRGLTKEELLERNRRKHGNGK